MKKRIWELDALRGLFILGMVIVHFVIDLFEIYALVEGSLPGWFVFVRSWGGVLFFLLSGISVTLGRRHIFRGLVVFGGGMLCTLVTFAMVKLGFFHESMMIYFGVLHCLGACMLLWGLLRRLPWWALLPLGIAFIGLGLWMRGQSGVDTVWLMPLGLPWKNFYSSDYFPLLPNLGYFLVGSVLGRTLYREKQTLLPQVNERQPILAFLQLCGRQSLWIYLLHQPILSGFCMLLDAIL